MFHSLRPLVRPGESPSTMKAVNALLAGVPGSAVLARTKYLSEEGGGGGGVEAGWS